VVGSSVSGKNVAVVSLNDVNIVGSTLTASEALQLNAGRDLNVTSAAANTSERHREEQKKSGFSFGTGGVGYSKAQQKSTGEGASVTQVGSSLSGGTVTATSGRDTLLSASTVVARCRRYRCQYRCRTQP
jgi:filamentous hemagglutinin